MLKVDDCVELVISRNAHRLFRSKLGISMSKELRLNVEHFHLNAFLLERLAKQILNYQY